MFSTVMAIAAYLWIMLARCDRLADVNELWCPVLTGDVLGLTWFAGCGRYSSSGAQFIFFVSSGQCTCSRVSMSV